MKFAVLRAMWLATTVARYTQAAGILSNPAPELLTLLPARIATLDSAISCYTGEDADFSPIQSASNALVITLDRGLRDISVGPNLTTAETQAMVPLFENLTTSCKTTMLGLIERKPRFLGTTTTSTPTSCSSAGKLLIKYLSNQRAVWEKLFTLITAKAPQNQAGLVAAFANAVDAATQEALDTFTNAMDSSSSSSTADCSPNDESPPSRIELRSYHNANASSTLSNVTVTAAPSHSSAASAAPVYTGAAAAVHARRGGGGAWGLKMVGKGMGAVAGVAVAVAVAVAVVVVVVL
ncbi:cell wall mannoprotein 1 family protein [Aspergillus stella-maris]|uniref:cell wall mannoprotein 1 family protein n=1 Tax=Aspergillus stella-maris TaxID=1810926 RepID=UPI003CCD7493